MCLDSPKPRKLGQAEQALELMGKLQPPLTSDLCVAMRDAIPDLLSQVVTQASTPWPHVPTSRKHSSRNMYNVQCTCLPYPLFSTG